MPPRSVRRQCKSADLAGQKRPQVLYFDGEPGGTRTRDHRIKSVISIVPPGPACSISSYFRDSRRAETHRNTAPQCKPQCKTTNRILRARRGQAGHGTARRGGVGRGEEKTYDPNSAGLYFGHQPAIDASVPHGPNRGRGEKEPRGAGRNRRLSDPGRFPGAIYSRCCAPARAGRWSRILERQGPGKSPKAGRGLLAYPAALSGTRHGSLRS